MLLFESFAPLKIISLGSPGTWQSDKDYWQFLEPRTNILSQKRTRGRTLSAHLRYKWTVTIDLCRKAGSNKSGWPMIGQRKEAGERNATHQDLLLGVNRLWILFLEMQPFSLRIFLCFIIFSFEPLPGRRFLISFMDAKVKISEEYIAPWNNEKLAETESNYSARWREKERERKQVNFMRGFIKGSKSCEIPPLLA